MVISVVGTVFSCQDQSWHKVYIVMTTTDSTDKHTARNARSGNMVDIIHRHLRRMVVEFDLRPGERLNEQVLCAQLEIGRTPLREAINRLVAEKLVVARPNKGFYVRDVNPEEIAHLFEVREVLEGAIARLVVARASDAELIDLQGFWQNVLENYAHAEPEDLLAQDIIFHERLARLTQNDEFARLVADINDRVYLVRWAVLQGDARKNTFDEHAQIISALIARDADRAASLMQQHVGKRTGALRRAIADGLLHVISKSSAELRVIDLSEGNDSDDD